MPVADRLAAAARALVARADAAPRVDAAPIASGATVTNALSGLGGARDSGATARPNLDRDYLSQEELIALMRGSVYRRIVELKPRWATMRGWTITDDTDEERPHAERFRALNLQGVVQAADTWARALGESRVLLVTDDPAPLDEPLNPSKVRRLHRLEVLDRREFTPTHFNGDVEAGPLGEPDLFSIHPRRAGVASGVQTVHASRLLRFYGDDLPPSERGFNWTGTGGWGADAIGQTLWDGIRHLSQTGAGGARLAQELSISVFKLQNAAGATAGDQREAYLGRLRALNMMKSIANAVFLQANEDFQRVAAAPSGFADLSTHAKEELALLTGYPLTLLFGIAPGGLGTDGESWQEAWRTDVASYQDTRYREFIERVAEILYWSESGGVPDEWSVEFRPLGDLSEAEKAQIRLTHTQADSTAILDGVLTPAEARERYTQPGGFVYDLQPVGAAAPEPPPIDPEVEAGARAAVEAAMVRGDAKAGAAWIGLPLPESALVAIGAARAVVEAVTGPLTDPGDAPHITVLYLGAVDPEALGEIEGAVTEVAARTPAPALSAGRVSVFPEGPDGWPVVLQVGGAWSLDGLNGTLLRRLAHRVSARQHGEYRAHVTLGYAPSLTPEQRAAAIEAAVPEIEWVAARLELRHGEQLLTVAPLAGRTDAAAA